MILVTGGAGYIGSHMVDMLCEQGRSVVVLDDLSSGSTNNIHSDAPFYQGDIADKKVLSEIFKQNKISSVMHFASRIQVEESVKNPQSYYHNNVVKTLSLVSCMLEHNIKQFIFSSSAAVYGIPDYLPVREDHTTCPVNPYGRTKLMVEQILADYSKAYGFNYVALRYFNAAGAHSKGHLPNASKHSSSLIAALFRVVVGKADTFKVYGDDYDTKDGSGVRDFVHVLDLCSAHMLALEYLKQDQSAIFNLGTGNGFSVYEILAKLREITGHDIPVEVCQRRSGDLAVMTADASKIRRLCGWQAPHSNIQTILQDTWSVVQTSSRDMAH